MPASVLSGEPRDSDVENSRLVPDLPGSRQFRRVRLTSPALLPFVVGPDLEQEHPPGVGRHHQEAVRRAGAAEGGEVFGGVGPAVTDFDTRRFF